MLIIKWVCIPCAYPGLAAWGSSLETFWTLEKKPAWGWKTDYTAKLHIGDSDFIIDIFVKIGKKMFGLQVV